jgi:hypothetical protein
LDVAAAAAAAAAAVLESSQAMHEVVRLEIQLHIYIHPTALQLPPSARHLRCNRNLNEVVLVPLCDTRPSGKGNLNHGLCVKRHSTDLRGSLCGRWVVRFAAGEVRPRLGVATVAAATAG